MKGNEGGDREEVDEEEGIEMYIEKQMLSRMKDEGNKGKRKEEEREGGELRRGVRDESNRKGRKKTRKERKEKN